MPLWTDGSWRQIPEDLDILRQPSSASSSIGGRSGTGESSHSFPHTNQTMNMPQWTEHQPQGRAYDHIKSLEHGGVSKHLNQNGHTSDNASSYVSPYLFVPPRATLQASVIQLLQEKRGFTPTDISRVTGDREDDESVAALLDVARQVEYGLPDADSLLFDFKGEPSLTDFGDARSGYAECPHAGFLSKYEAGSTAKLSGSNVPIKEEPSCNASFQYSNDSDTETSLFLPLMPAGKVAKRGSPTTSFVSDDRRSAMRGTSSDGCQTKMAYSDKSSTPLSRISDTLMTDAPPMTAATQAFSSRSRSPTSPASPLAYTGTLDGSGELSPAGADYSDMDTTPADYPSDSEDSRLSAPPSDYLSSYMPTSRETKMEDLRSALDSLGCLSLKTIDIIVSNAGNPDYISSLAEGAQISDVSEPSSAGRSMEGYTGGNHSGSDMDYDSTVSSTPTKSLADKETLDQLISPTYSEFPLSEFEPRPTSVYETYAGTRTKEAHEAPNDQLILESGSYMYSQSTSSL